MNSPAALPLRIGGGELIGRWVAHHVRGRFHPEDSTALGLARGNDILAGVIYENWNGRSITCHIAVAGRMTPRFVATIFDYPFNRCGVNKIICPVAEGNTASRRLVQKMGFIVEARVRDAHPTGDLIIYTMARGACRFIGERYGKRLESAARH